MSKQNALVTGASRGIGLAIANRLKQDGFRVLTPGRNQLDLLLDESIDGYISKLKCPVDVLVNNAGINLLGSIGKLSESNIKDTMQVNLTAPLKLILKLAPSMIKRKYGKIVNIGSIWGFVTKPDRITYTISKSGLGGLTRSLAVELATYNILVNCVAPGYVNTELTNKNNSKSEIEKIKKSIPLGRLCQPQEVAELTAFLCSKKNTYITGQVIAIDGGYLCL